MKNSEVAEHFLKGGYEAKTKNLFIEQYNNKLIIYSYGYHFPICVKLSDGTYIFNSDGYSRTTAKHKGDVARVLGYANFKAVQDDTNALIVRTGELKDIIENNQINSYNDFIANKI